MNKTKFLLSIAVSALVAVPIALLAQETINTNGGIFGCDKTAVNLNSSVGAFSATGGAYVPVADYTVELNTGTLVYLECVLRGIVVRQSESINAAMTSKIIDGVLTGNEGGKMFRTQPLRGEVVPVANRVALKTLQEAQSLSDAVTTETGGSNIKSAAQSYLTSRQSNQWKCPYDIDLAACRKAEVKSPECIDALIDSRCKVFFQRLFLTQEIQSNVAAEIADVRSELDQGNGFYSKTHLDENGNRIIETPSSVVEAQAIQALTSGFRRVENANNIDQMVGSLYAGLGTQVLTGSGGLASIDTRTGTGISYLDTLVRDSNASLNTAALNLAYKSLLSAIAVEEEYRNTLIKIRDEVLRRAVNRLRNMESQCWDLLVFNTSTNYVCRAFPVNNKCTGTVSGKELTIATSTKFQFAQPVIDEKISPLQAPINQRITTSEAALNKLTDLKKDYSSPSAATRKAAVEKFNSMVKQGVVHTAQNLETLRKQQSSIAELMDTTVANTKTLWTENDDAAKGWCKADNQAVINLWDERWQ